MEKKKLLLVAVSVGVFLVIVISASILIFTPKTGAGASLSASRQIPAGPGATLLPSALPEASLPLTSLPQAELMPEVLSLAALPQAPSSLDSTSLVKSTQGVRGIQQSSGIHTLQETQFYINGEQPFENPAAGKTNRDSAANITINVPSPSAAAVPDVQATASRPAESPRRTAAPAKPAPVAAKSAPVKPAPKPQAKTAAKPAAASAKPAAQSSQKAYNDYWVQTGAFSTKVRAEGVKDTLASKGITSIIVNREQDGKTLFRVRVGPYTSKTEANYWLELVKSIDEFSGSMVFQTPRL